MSKHDELLEKIKELEAKVAGGEEAALARVCKALNIQPEEIKEKKELPPEKIIRCHVPTPVRVNSTVYFGTVEVGKSTFDVIQQALGDRRQRLLRELTGNNYILRELESGGFAPQLVGTHNE